MSDRITLLSKEVFYENVSKRIKKSETAKLAKIKIQIKELGLTQPDWAMNLLEKSQEEYQGKHILPGTDAKPFFMGIPPKWKLRAVTDKESVWCLNRMYHWNDFIIAYYMTDDKKYALKIKEELLDWICECPPPDITADIGEARERFENVTPWRTLEVGIRMFEVWPNVIHFLIVENLLDAQSLEAIALSVYQHGVVLYSISPMLWPEANHNHYLMENLGLLYLCNLFPEFCLASDWSAHANEQIIRCAKKQISPDGAQIEGCPTYHNICMDFFCLWIILLEESGAAVSQNIKDQIEKGLDYSITSFRPCGGSVPWGDSDADYSAVKAAVLGYRAFHKDKWIVYLKGMIGIEKLKSELTTCILDVGDLDMLQISLQNKVEETLPLYSFQRQINQVSYRTSWENNAYHLQFGCQMPNGNGHAHIDPLSFDFSALGRSMVVDPGRFTYDEANDRKLFKSAEMHNCLLIDNNSPYEYLSSWRFGVQHDGCVLKAKENPEYFWTQGVHTCYFPAIHQRLLSVIKKRFLLIWDDVQHLEGKHHISIYFHVDAEKLYEGDDPGSYLTKHEQGANLYICSLSKMQAKLLPGYVAEQIDTRHLSTRVCYEDVDACGRKDYITLVIPFETNPPIVKQSRLYYREAGICIDISVDEVEYRLQWDGEKFTMRENNNEGLYQ